jgi:glycine/D-amino acid oxidase-like deaminating enzyme
MARDVLIIGGGAIGSAIACFLARRGDFDGRIVVLERDPTYRTASSALSASSIRQQFSTPLNIALSRFGLEVLRDPATHFVVDAAAPDLGLSESGYLILAGHGGGPALAATHAVQRRNAVDVELLTPAELTDRLPWLAVDGIAAGSLGLAGEGWFDGYGLLQALRRTARALGVRYLAEEVVGLDRRGRGIEAVRLASGDRLAGDLFVNAAGPWAARVAGFAAIDLPVRARRRVVHVFSCRTPLPGRPPLVADPSGLWFRPEGALYIAGTSPLRGEPDEDDLPLDAAAESFEDKVWPLLAQRVPAFEAVKSNGAWAGYYEVNTFDHNGIIGPHPEVDNLLFANGFSGHGLQHAPGIGRGLAEWIALGRYETLDLAPLGYDRLLSGTPYPEINVI